MGWGKITSTAKKLVATGASGLVLLEKMGLQVMSFVSVTCICGHLRVSVAGSGDEQDSARCLNLGGMKNDVGGGVGKLKCRAWRRCNWLEIGGLFYPCTLYSR